MPARAPQCRGRPALPEVEAHAADDSRPGRPHRRLLDCRHRCAPSAGQASDHWAGRDAVRSTKPARFLREPPGKRNTAEPRDYRRMCRLVGAAGVRFPKTATPVCVPTYTRPLTMVGVMNLLPGPRLSRPPAARLELYSSCARFVAS